MSWKLKRAIKKQVDELARCPSSRMTEEIFKVLYSGSSSALAGKFVQLGLFSHMLPRIDSLLRSGSKEVKEAFYCSLDQLDRMVQVKSEDRKGRMLVYLVAPFLKLSLEGTNSADLFSDTFKEVKQLIEPITPPNHEVEMAVIKLFRSSGIRAPKNVGVRQRSAGMESAGEKEKENRRRRNQHRRRRKPDVSESGSPSEKGGSA